MRNANGEPPNSLKQGFIAEQTAKGGFGSENEVQMLAKEAQVRESRLLLESKLLDGLKSDVSPMTNGDWDGLKQEVLNA